MRLGRAFPRQYQAQYRAISGGTGVSITVTGASIGASSTATSLRVGGGLLSTSAEVLGGSFGSLASGASVVSTSAGTLSGTRTGSLAAGAALSAWASASVAGTCTISAAAVLTALSSSTTAGTLSSVGAGANVATRSADAFAWVAPCVLTSGAGLSALASASSFSSSLFATIGVVLTSTAAEVLGGGNASMGAGVSLTSIPGEAFEGAPGSGLQSGAGLLSRSSGSCSGVISLLSAGISLTSLSTETYFSPLSSIQSGSGLTSTSATTAGAGSPVTPRVSVLIAVQAGPSVAWGSALPDSWKAGAGLLATPGASLATGGSLPSSVGCILTETSGVAFQGATVGFVTTGHSLTVLCSARANAGPPTCSSGASVKAAGAAFGGGGLFSFTSAALLGTSSASVSGGSTSSWRLPGEGSCSLALFAQGAMVTLVSANGDITLVSHAALVKEAAAGAQIRLVAAEAALNLQVK